jgi:Ca2+:H+ antiporter
VLSAVYLCYLVFQLFSHKNIYDNSYPNFQKPELHISKHNLESHVAEEERTVDATAFTPTSSLRHSRNDESDPNHDERDLEEGSVEEDEPQMSLPVTIALLIVITVVCSPSTFRVLRIDYFKKCLCITTECLVKSIDGLTTSTFINKEFVGLILLPILGNVEGESILRRPIYLFRRLILFTRDQDCGQGIS